MDWIRVEGNLPGHPKVGRLARTLRISRVTAVGHLVSLWCWSVQYAGEGRSLDPSETAEAAFWSGDQQRFFDALSSCGFIDNDGCLHDWQTYQGAIVEKRKRDREYAKKSREARATVARPSHDRSATVATHETRRNETIRNDKTETPPAPPAPPAGGARDLSTESGHGKGKAGKQPDPNLDGFEEWWAKLPPEMRKAPGKAREVWAGLSTLNRAKALKFIRPWCDNWARDWEARGRPQDSFPPFAANWLAQERWDDALPDAKLYPEQSPTRAAFFAGAAATAEPEYPPEDVQDTADGTDTADRPGRGKSDEGVNHARS
ncbi:MAG: hypothetical protein HY825_13485 [Acidobacteria bacterium]|nr:hypothetical protein [Acidobacteriota bacterium]